MSVNEGQTIRVALARLEALGPMAQGSRYQRLASELDPFWSSGVACNISTAVDFLRGLAVDITDPDDRAAAFDEAALSLHEAAVEWGGYDEDELLVMEMEAASMMEGFRQDIGAPLTDTPFPEPS